MIYMSHIVCSIAKSRIDWARKGFEERLETGGEHLSGIIHFEDGEDDIVILLRWMS
jgi:hypothetical protein